MLILPLLLVLLSALHSSAADPPPVSLCSNSSCFVSNAYGEWNTRQSCRVSKVFYPENEEQLLAAVAYGSKNKLKMKAVSKFSHSIPPLACPGGDAGVLISTARLNRTLLVDKSAMTIEADAGVQLWELLDAAAAHGLALAAGPYYSGLSIGGIIGTGSHGSARRRSAVHDHILALRLVVPFEPAKGSREYPSYSRVVALDLTGGDDLFDAALVSLGALGVVSRVTLKLELQFKRSVTLRKRDDGDLEQRIASFGDEHDFGDVTWYPSKHEALYRIDDRLPVEAEGDGMNQYLGFQPTLVPVVEAQRALEEHLDGRRSSTGKCLASSAQLSILHTLGYGWKNSPLGLFTGYPVVGLQHRMQAAGGCERSSSSKLMSCPWDSSHAGLFYYEAGFTIAASRISDFIRDVKKLRAAVGASAMCGLDLYTGVLLRYVGPSRAILGKQEPGVDVGFTYFRPRKPGGSAEADIWAEVEQMASLKYAALPHWGKNKPVAFFTNNIDELYPRKEAFVAAMKSLDPQRLFSSEWSDAVLGLLSSPPAHYGGDGCALEGMCICSRDEHCAPSHGFYCRPGRVYSPARVCRYEDASKAKRM